MTRSGEGCQTQNAAARILNCFHRAHIAILGALALAWIAVGFGSQFSLLAEWYRHFGSRMPSWIDGNVMFGIGVVELLAIIVLALKPRSGG